jgi:hypothetical protein
MHSICGFAYRPGCERVREGPVITGESTHKLSLLLTWGFDGTFECGFNLPARAASWALSRGSRAPPVLAFEGGLCCVGPS